MSIIIRNNLLLFLTSILYLFSISYFLAEDKLILLSIPLLLCIVILSLFNYKYLFFLVVILTPFSVSLADLGLFLSDVEMAFPTEPILFGFMILILFLIAYQLNTFRSIFRHPITLCILMYLFWIFITSITSTSPIVSFKFLLTRLWYIIPIFFLGITIFQNKNNIFYFVLFYVVPLSIVIIYTSIKHAGFLFDKESAHYMMSPFFNDHTSYGAIIAFFLPLTVGVCWIKKNNILLRFFLFSIIIILIIGLVLSFTRAAWISLFISIIIGLMIRFKINRKFLFISPLIILIVFIFFQTSILTLLESNRQDSSDNLIEHVTSISNISTDASNMERINRWKCALKMFLEKPFFGWGPGTYQFEYARFQLYNDRTIISSNSGDMGNAHSEYLGALSESGILGLITLCVLVLVSVISAINMYYSSRCSQQRTLLLSIVISLISYFIHGFFNNFLDTDKASVAIWAVFAMLVAIDLVNDKKQSNSISFR
ncbi:MAG: hypothetical protein CMP49_02265 [Flavobacteriales bacterium]|nr:hypothetical protein [Flavobacteriales bacterium]|tara:strand:+ start:11713 stop:13164 length:1452 start_codon:yes stop_codon:yes gene_type:complete